MSPKTIASTAAVLDDVIHCAAESFKGHGYKNTTVEDISSQLHISKKTLYGLFASKEEILKEVAWRETLRHVRDFSDTISRESTPDTQLIAFARFIFTDRIKEGRDGRFWGLLAGEDIVRRAYRSCLKRIVAGIYESGRKRGLFKEVDAGFAAETVAGMIFTALECFPNTDRPTAMFNSALALVADAVAHKHRIPFESLG